MSKFFKTQGCPQLENLLKIKAGETTEDLEFSVEVVACVGACAMAPVVVVNEKYYRNASPTDMREITGQESDGGEG